MTQQEFETPTGIVYAHGEFDDFVNPLYMAAGQLDKDKFCIEFKHHKDYLLNSKIVTALVTEVETLRSTQQKYEHEMNAIERSRTGLIDDFAYTLIEIAAGTKDLETRAKARSKAIKLIGIKEYIRRRIELCCELDKEDLIVLRDEILK